MADLIDRDALLAAYDAAHKGPPGGARKLIVEAPAVDAVEVIRCKDCLFWTGFKLADGTECEGVCDVGEERCITNSNGYCYWAEEAKRND
jgi:hypothetical protein